jgi:hypothetical protein
MRDDILKINVYGVQKYSNLSFSDWRSIHGLYGQAMVCKSFGQGVQFTFTLTRYSADMSL